MGDLYIANLRRAVWAARVNARAFLDQEGIPPEDQGVRRFLSRKWRRVQHARHEQALDRIRSLRHARKEEARFLGDL